MGSRAKLIDNSIDPSTKRASSGPNAANPIESSGFGGDIYPRQGSRRTERHSEGVNAVENLQFGDIETTKLRKTPLKYLPSRVLVPCSRASSCAVHHDALTRQKNTLRQDEIVTQRERKIRPKGANQVRNKRQHILAPYGTENNTK